MPVLLILVLPLALRLPFWAAGLRDSPIWSAGALTLPGGSQPLPGLPGFLDLNAGWTTQALGGLAARQWLAGQVPWWNPFSGIGLPLAAEMQCSALFLPYVLLLALPGGTVLLGLALQWTAGLATWRLLRRMELGPAAATAGALLFELSASFAWLGPPAGLPVAFLPSFLLGLERARAAAQEGRSGGWRLIAVSVALSLYAGFPETAYLDGLLALLWAIVRFAGMPGRRLGFAVRVAGGGIAGLLLAAPVLWPFFDLLSVASLGMRDGMSMTPITVPPAGLAQFLMPYALGLPAGLSDRDPTGTLSWLWGRSGGYTGAVLALAALLGAVGDGPNRVLRRVLAAWVVMLLGRTMGVPGLELLFRLIPLHDHLQVFRYAGAAWLLPCCILAVHAAEQRAAPRRTWLAAGLLLALGAVCAAVAWPLVRQVPTLPAYLAASLAWGGASLLAGTIAFVRGSSRAVLAVLVLDAAVLFAVPLASGQRDARLDRAAIGFLQDRLGLQRFATLGPFQPNYGAPFGIASVNHQYLPLPAVWSDHVLAHLRPGGDGVLFIGNFPPDAPGRPTNAEVMADHLRDYADLGVRYLIAPPGPNPFAPAPPAPPSEQPVAFALGGAATLSGELPAPPQPVVAVSVAIGTYAGRSDGTLTIELCGADGCVEGRAPLAGARDNAPLEIPLDRPVPPRGLLSWTLRHQGTHPVAIWRWSGPGGPAPWLVPRAAPRPGEPIEVYADPILTIYELPDPAPYFTVAGGPCTLVPMSRTELDARCDGPATLIRRELMMPGWRVRVGESDRLPDRADPLFQAVGLPAGTSHVTFRYTPPGAPAFTALFALGLLGLLPWDGMIRRVRSTRTLPGVSA